MMRIKRIALAVVLVLAVCVGGVGFFFQHQNQKSQNILHLSVEQKLSDFDALWEILEESYPFWEEVEQAGIDREAVYGRYRAEIPETKTDIAYFKHISYFLKEFDGLGHLSVLDGYLYGLYMDTIAESGSLLSPQEQQRVEILRAVLESPVSQGTYRLLDQSHEGFRSTIGLKEAYAAQKQDPEKETPRTPIVAEIDGDGKTAYLKIDSFALENYQEDKSALEEFFLQIEGVPDLILDLRGNRGGSDLYWEELLVRPNAKERLTSERYFLFQSSALVNGYASSLGIAAQEIEALPEPLLAQYGDGFPQYTVDFKEFAPGERPYPGRIWVLVDDQVYSAAENFVVFCKNTGFAALVGTPTGGDGGIADPVLVSLPNSGLIVRFSVFYGLNADGSGNEAKGTEPDHVAADGQEALEVCKGLIAELAFDEA